MYDSTTALLKDLKPPSLHQDGQSDSCNDSTRHLSKEFTGVERAAEHKFTSGFCAQVNVVLAFCKEAATQQVFLPNTAVNAETP